MSPLDGPSAEPAILRAGRLHKQAGFPSRFLKTARDLIVYLPPSYEEQPLHRFPILYLQDGQNLFDGATSFIPGMYWRVGETADELIAAGAIRPLVIVGIYNAGKRRIGEYTPTRAPRLGGGHAARYARMLIEELKPFVDSRYRTLTGAAHTGLGGSSLGGLLTLYAGLRFSQVFGKLAALSPSVWWGNRWMHRFAARANANPQPRIWLDIGTREGPRVVHQVASFRDVLVEKGWVAGRDLHYEEVEGGEHNEAAWARRVGPFLQFLFPADETAV